MTIVCQLTITLFTVGNYLYKHMNIIHNGGNYSTRPPVDTE